MDAQDRDDDTQDEVEGNEELVQSASGPSEEAIQNTRQCDGSGVHPTRGTNENPLP